jgi:membrane protein
MAELVENVPIATARRVRSRAVATPRTGSKPVRFLKQLGRDLIADKIEDLGAMMAYYAVLSLFPMLVFVVTLASLVIDESTVQQGVAMATEAMPVATRALLANTVAKFTAAAHSGLAIGGAALALWGASRGAASLGDALNAMYGKEETRGWFRRQLTAIGVTFAVAVFVVAALGLLVVGPYAGHFIADRFGLGDAFESAWNIGRWIGAGLLVMFVWAIAYRFLPDTDAPFRVFTPGAIVGVLAWLGISYAFSIYLGHFNSYETTYGALGAAIIFLTWLWMSNIALLFGAELNDVLADFRKHHSAAAAQLADENEHAGAPA